MLLDEVDPRLQPVLRAEWERRRHERVEGLPCDVTVVLVGHRAAGKTTLLPHVAKALGRSGVDLDAELVRRHQRPLKEWVETDERDFRSAERATFRELPSGLVVAVGGGFLAHHAELLRGCIAVEVPISFETYVERLMQDQTRGRLRPELSLENELREVYAEREYRHAAARPLSLVDFMLRLVRGRRPRRVVTLPPHTPLDAFAWKARHQGADLVEVRSDLHPPELDLLAASRALPLLLARRTPRLPDEWLRHGSLIDEPQDGEPAPSMVRSFHADRPLTTREALAKWADVAPGSRVKHVEPLGEPSTFPRLLETQAALLERFGFESVTVLATGPLALPFRAVLAQKNALDYLALNSAWAAAQGQRLLADATREARRAVVDGSTRRLGILGSSIGHSRSPRLPPAAVRSHRAATRGAAGRGAGRAAPALPGLRGDRALQEARVAAEVLTELSAVNTLDPQPRDVGGGELRRRRRRRGARRAVPAAPRCGHRARRWRRDRGGAAVGGAQGRGARGAHPRHRPARRAEGRRGVDLASRRRGA